MILSCLQNLAYDGIITYKNVRKLRWKEHFNQVNEKEWTNMVLEKEWAVNQEEQFWREEERGAGRS